MKLKQLPKTELPREKLIKFGKENLSDSELLALILKTGTKEENVMELSLNILNKIEKIENLKEINYEGLLKIKGIGKAKAIELLAVTELSKRLYFQTEERKIKLSTPKIIFEN